MKNAEYWQQRFKQLEAAQHQLGANGYAQIEKQYSRAQADLEAQIAKWYQRFASNNGLTMADAKKYLQGAALKEFKWDVQEYIQYGKDNALTGSWMKELENASAKYHISKLEALKIQTKQSLQQLYTSQLGITSKTLQSVYKSGYYHTAYELQKGFNVGWDISSIDQSQLEKVLSEPWAVDGYNFSERIWNSKEKLISEVHNQLTQGVLLGKDPQKAIDTIAAKMNTSKHNAGRLVMTEEAYFSSVAQKDCFNSLDVEEYEIVATLDSHTSEICRGMDGKHFPMKDYEPGVTAPPFHVYCRSTTAPYFADDFGSIGERAARDENGKTYYVPADMSYKDWKQTFVDGGDKSGLDIYDTDGTVHYAKHVEPVAEKEKKKYVTKKTLQADIANIDVQLESLVNDFEKQSGGLFTWEDFKKNYNSDYQAISYDNAEAAAYKKIGDQIDALEIEKADLNAKLDEKLLKEKKKALVKQKAALEAQKDAIQQQLDDIKVKTYSGIWKNDVTTADWSSLNIQGKKDYFENQLSNSSLTSEKKAQFEAYLKQLDELDVEGKNYADVQKELKKIQSDLNKAQADLTALENGGTILVDDTFSQERKDAAKWFDRAHGGFNAADNYFDPPAKAVHKAATAKEHDGFYTYTRGSGGHNRPLAGFEKPWSKGGSGWEEEFSKGAKNVWIDFEGKGEQIRGLTTLIEKSTYADDVWLQSGQDFQTLEGLNGFLQVPYGTLQKMTDEQLKQFIGTEKKFYQFISCAVNEGGGSMFNEKPMKLNIYAPKGSEMLYASDVGAFGKGENEMILQRGGTYKITNMYWGIDHTDGNRRKIFVDMELHPEAGYDKFQQDPNEWKGSRKNYRD